MIAPAGWRWTKAAPTFPLDFEPSEERRTSSSEGGVGKTRLRLKLALVGSDGRLSGRRGALWWHEMN